MGNYFNKTFKRSQCVKAIIFDHDKRIKAHYVIPKDSQIKIGGKLYEINQDDFYLSKGIPTYVYNVERVDPINLFNVEKSVLTASYYDTAISTNVAKQIFAASQEGVQPQNIILILTGVTMLVMLLGFYIMYNELTAIYEFMNEYIFGVGGNTP